MKIAYFDCIAGASGDMILGALLDAGLAESVLRERLAALHLVEFELRVSRVSKLGFAATKVDVLVQDDVPARHLGDIERLVTESALDAGIQARAVEVFRALGEVEAGIHGSSLAEVHLHELGGVDTIVDVVGALVGLDELGVEAVYASPLPLGRGFVSGAHGQIPLPAPATVSLLVRRGVPITGSPVDKETVTPTGAALLATLAASFGPIPPMTLRAVGYGAGGRDLPIPNVLRVLLGESADDHPHAHKHGHDQHHAHNHEHGHAHPHAHEHGHEHAHPHAETLTVLETNLDDSSPEFCGYVLERLFAAGALDVWMQPLQMKKNRPATLLGVLCAPEQAEALREVLFIETSTLGVRALAVQRYALPRATRVAATPYGEVRVKVAQLPGGAFKAAPEYEDCRRIALAAGVPLREVYRVAGNCEL